MGGLGQVSLSRDASGDSTEPLLSPPNHHHHHDHCIEFGAMKIGVASVMAFTFFNVSGGPWGSEEIFSNGGPLMGVVGILLFSICFGIPQCLLTAELCCALPRNGGYAVWVREALGDFWGVQEVYWQWASGVADAAVYPVLVTDTIMQLIGRTDVSMFEVWTWRMSVTAFISLPTFVSFHVVPGLLIVFAFGTAMPVFAFVVYGSFMVNPRVWLQTTTKKGTPWSVGKMINAVFWNLEGWDSISACTSMVSEPREKIIPKGLFWSLIVTVIQYIAVLLVAAGVSEKFDPWYTWDDGSLPSIGAWMGPCMGVWMLLASVIGNAGQYLSEFVEDSCLLQGAAEAGIAPAIFAKQLPISKSPYVASLFQFFLISLMVVFDFSDILVFDNFFTGMAVLLQFVSFFVLRWQRPDLPRPYKVPKALIALFFPGLAILLYMLYHCFVKAGNASIITVIAFAVGMPYGFWVAYRERRRKDLGEFSALDELFER